MLKRKDFTLITVLVDNCCGGFSRLNGVLISKNKRWLYFWKLVDFRIDGRVLVRRSQVHSYDKQKMSKFQYRVLKTLDEFNKIDIESEIKLPRSDRKVLKKIANKTSSVINTGSGDSVVDIKKIGKNRITFTAYSTNLIFPKQRVYIEDVFMLHIDSKKALTYSLFSK